MMKYVYEFIGTFFLMLTVGLTVLPPGGASNFAPLAIGTALAVMVYAGGHVSGAHYNPAVSLAIFLRGKLDAKELLPYWIAQLLGAIAAALITLYIKGAGAATPMSLDVAKTFLVEFLFAFALCYVVLNVATAEETKGNSYFGFAIGFAVLMGAYAAGAVSGGAFNPAVGLGITALGIVPWSSLWIYIVANLLGGVAAAYIFKAAHRR